MNKILLNNEDIIEIQNIINCLLSLDEETFKLGKSLIPIKFNGINFFIPIGDILISFMPYYVSLYYYYARNSVTNIVCILKRLIRSKYYVISS